jgi:putative salt-induced outer membrane protein YdiY
MILRTIATWLLFGMHITGRVSEAAEYSPSPPFTAVENGAAATILDNLDPGPIRLTTKEIARVAEITRKKSPWSGTVQLGSSLTRGNNSTVEAHVEAKVLRELHPWRTELELRSAYGKADQRATRENIQGKGKQDYFYTERLYLYLQGEALKDRFRDLNFRGEAGPGAGRIWLKTERTLLESELGFLYSYQDLRSGTSKDFYFGRLAGKWQQKIHAMLRGSLDIEFLPELTDPTRDYRARGKGALHIDLPYQLLLAFEIINEYNNTVPPGVEKNDIQFISSVGFRF